MVSAKYIIIPIDSEFAAIDSEKCRTPRHAIERGANEKREDNIAPAYHKALSLLILKSHLYNLKSYIDCLTLISREFL